MSWPVFWNGHGWWWPTLIAGGVVCLLAASVYWRERQLALGHHWPLLLRVCGVALLVLCLAEPQSRREVPEDRANLLIALVDRSRSMELKDQVSGAESRAGRLAPRLASDEPWIQAAEKMYDFRQYVVDRNLNPVDQIPTGLPDGPRSQIPSALKQLGERLQGQAVAGILLFSDGNATEDWSIWEPTPGVPIYPVRVAGNVRRDLRITGATATVSNFESAPVTLTVTLGSNGMAGEKVSVVVQDINGQEVSRQDVASWPDQRPVVLKFEIRPPAGSVHCYQVAAFRQTSSGTLVAAPSDEASAENNRRWQVVRRGQGPYRVLYVGGRPNWEYKFLARALADDPELQLDALVRVAKREPKFSFRSRRGESSNPLFRGFGNDELDETEAYSQPVMVAFSSDADRQKSLPKEFPRTAADLFAYDAIIIDDLEADFFSSDQMALLESFVGRRGGGFLMLGGQESFVKGGYHRTPIGNLLPVYLDRPRSTGNELAWNWMLTRDGWLQSWVRLRGTESAEAERLGNMPGFQTINPVSALKPGATVLAEITTESGRRLPGLVWQKFGKGVAGALLVGDVWRWQLAGETTGDPPQAWRQLVRGLTAEVPRRFEWHIDHENAEEMQAVVRTRDPEFRPDDSYQVRARLIPLTGNSSAASLPSSSQPARQSSGNSELASPQPQHNDIAWLPAEPSAEEPGMFEARLRPPNRGPYRVEFEVRDAAGELVQSLEGAWVAQPGLAELNEVNAATEQLARVAAQSGGPELELSELLAFSETPPTHAGMQTRTLIQPWWHQWPLFLAALACFIGEWGVRRRRGLR